MSNHSASPSPSVSPIAEAPALKPLPCPFCSNPYRGCVVVPVLSKPLKSDSDVATAPAGDVLTEEERALVEHAKRWAAGYGAGAEIHKLLAIIARLSGRESV